MFNLKFPYEETQFPARVFDPTFCKKLVAKGVKLLAIFYEKLVAEGICANIKPKASHYQTHKEDIGMHNLEKQNI